MSRLTFNSRSLIASDFRVTHLRALPFRTRMPVVNADQLRRAPDRVAAVLRRQASGELAEVGQQLAQLQVGPAAAVQ